MGSTYEHYELIGNCCRETTIFRSAYYLRFICPHEHLVHRLYFYKYIIYYNMCLWIGRKEMPQHPKMRWAYENEIYRICFSWKRIQRKNSCSFSNKTICWGMANVLRCGYELNSLKNFIFYSDISFFFQSSNIHRFYSYVFAYVDYCCCLFPFHLYCCCCYHNNMQTRMILGHLVWGCICAAAT